MKKLVQAVFLVFCAIALGLAVYYYLSSRSGAADASRPVATRRVVLGGESPAPDAEAEREAREAATNRISALPNEVVLDVDTLNLDQDEGEEQVLTVRKTDRADGRISVVVADWVPSRRGWTRSWEGETLATKLTTFSIQVRDLVGDHNLNLACAGMNDRGEQTLVVFRRVAGPDQELLSYGIAGAFEADSISVEEVERSEGYQLGQTNGESFPIVAWRRDKDSENLLDQVRTTYSWDYRKAAWVESASQRIPGALVEREMAARVLTGVAEDFERFLRGVWYESGAGPRDPKARLIVFDRAAGSITFFSAESQEVFRWNESHPTRYGIYAGALNESVPDLRRLLDIELKGADTISVRIFEDLRMKVDADYRWDGDYRKLPAGAEGSSGAPARGPAGVHLEGIFRGSRGETLSLEGRGYSLTREGRVERGGFSLYAVGGVPLLELVELKENGLIASRRSYRIELAETRRGKELRRLLTLSPARAAITGVEILEEAPLVLEQLVDG